MRAKAAALLLLLIWARSAAGVPYWPDVEGATIQYNDGTTTTISSGESLLPAGQVVYAFAGPSCSMVGGFGVDDQGDVYTTGGSFSCIGGFDPDFWGFGIPVKFLDLPLHPTKTWSNTYDAGFFQPVTVVGRVMGFGTLSLPAGNLYYYEVVIIGISPYVDGVYWINEHYGPLRLPSGATFVGATGIVSSEPGTWGGVKALYR